MFRRDALGQAAASVSVHRLIAEAASQSQLDPNKAADSQFMAIADAIHARAFQHIDFADLAREFEVSTPTMRRKCTAMHGVSPKNLQIRIRIDRAKELLTSTELSIDTITHEVGYEDSFYISHLFTQRENFSPSEFRNLHGHN